MSSSTSAARPRLDWGRYVALAVVAIVLVAAAVTAPRWLPMLRNFVTPGGPAASDSTADAAHDDHAGHDHGEDEANSIEISSQARKAMGLNLAQVKLRSYDRTIALPGIVVERAGRSRTQVVAPLAGIVTRIFVTEGEAVSPGRKLFEMRLTHEELVQMQADLLRTAEELEIVRREVARLEGVAREGAVAGRSVLERKYEQQKLEVALRVSRQALLLHHFNDAQIDEILQTRQLRQSLVVEVPTDDELGMELDPNAVFQIQSLSVERGQQVEHGAPLATLTDHSELVIEGDGFEQDAAVLAGALKDGAKITAVHETSDGTQQIPDLAIEYIADRLDPDTRTLHFYLPFANEIVRDVTNSSEQRYLEWKYKPGQRFTLRIPVESWTQRIVLPADAVASDGVENYVFVFRQGKFERRAVQVEYRDPQHAVIANDGSVGLGQFVATSAAQQLQLALKNKSGGGVDPHAGHTH